MVSVQVHTYYHRIHLKVNFMEFGMMIDVQE